jgi:hypothetical protein
MNTLINEWADAVNFYRYDEARAIAKTLVPLLNKAGATNKENAIDVDGVAYWVENHEIKRERRYFE